MNGNNATVTLSYREIGLTNSFHDKDEIGWLVGKKEGS